jgi:hypothetical protein
MLVHDQWEPKKGCIEAILQHGKPDLEARDLHGRTFLHRVFARDENNSEQFSESTKSQERRDVERLREVVVELLAAGANFECIDNNGETITETTYRRGVCKLWEQALHSHTGHHGFTKVLISADLCDGLVYHSVDDTMIKGWRQDLMGGGKVPKPKTGWVQSWSYYNYLQARTITLSDAFRYSQDEDGELSVAISELRAKISELCVAYQGGNADFSPDRVYCETTPQNIALFPTSDSIRQPSRNSGKTPQRPKTPFDLDNETPEFRKLKRIYMDAEGFRDGRIMYSEEGGPRFPTVQKVSDYKVTERATEERDEERPLVSDESEREEDYSFHQLGGKSYLAEFSERRRQEKDRVAKQMARPNGRPQGYKGKDKQDNRQGQAGTRDSSDQLSLSLPEVSSGIIDSSFDLMDIADDKYVVF